MCGFVGYLHLGTTSGPSFEGVLAEMSQLIAHRGPDDQGTLIDGTFGVAHRRLAVLDLSKRGHQPMRTADGDFAIATNAEIYNHRTLWRQFGQNQPLHSTTDTEVVLRLARQLGTEQCLAKLDGMFALAIWDRSKKRLTLARDPFGVKPLFTRVHKGVLWFASEIKPLLCVPGAPKQPSMEALHHFLSFDYIPGTHTAFEGIECLRPGHRLIASADSSQVHIAPYHTFSYTIDDNITLNEAIRESDHLLEQAVRRQLVADVPVGIMLSGGLDSTALVAMTRRAHPQKTLHTFGLGFADKSFDETADAALVASHFDTQHHAIHVKPNTVRDLFAKHLAHIDEPYADGSALPTYLLARAAKEHVTVLLSGEGGDELFAGYDTHTAHLARDWYRHIPQAFRKHCVTPLTKVLPVSHSKLSFDFKAKRFVAGAELGPAEAHHYWRMVLSEDAKSELVCAPERFKRFGPSNRLFVEAWNQAPATDPLNRLLHIDMQYHLPDDLMVKNDRMTMAHSLEARVPFCDLALARFLHTVPTAYKMHGWRRKHLLRAALGPQIPRRARTKKKLGLEMPYSRWIREDLRDFVQDWLSPGRIAEAGIFVPGAVQRLIDAHLDMDVDNGRAIWGLLSYVRWHAMYISSDDYKDHITPSRAPITLSRD